jgi:RecA-family ATPase
MKQTNIRIDDYFVMKNNDQYFLSDIDDYEQWRETDNLLDHKKKNVTSKLSELMNKYNVKYNVNFLTGQSGG